MRKLRLKVGLFIACTGVSVQAEIITDGSLGEKLSLQGPNFVIDARLGEQAGDNLFHSFESFNLNQRETASFTGPNSLSRIISRVTGGLPSSIDGIIHSAIPAVDLFFINPAGIAFGLNAQLDVPGAFHAGAVDGLQFSDGTTFSANPSDASHFSTAPPSAFGFLSGAVTVDSQVLGVKAGESLALAGHAIKLDQTILATSGGEIALQADNISAINSRITVSAIDGGKIVIRGGDVSLDSTQLDALTVDGPSEGIDLDLHSLSASNSRIETDTLGNGNAGPLNINTSGELVFDNSVIFANTRGGEDGTATGQGGQISLSADSIHLSNDSLIANLTFGSGDSGSINLTASSNLTLEARAQVNSSTDPRNAASGITGNAGNITIQAGEVSLLQNSSITSTTRGDGGNAGDITLSADNAKLTDASQISTFTFGSGNAGDIAIGLKGNLEVLNSNPADINGGSVISANSLSSTDNAGAPGNLAINAADVTITNGSRISVFNQNHVANNDAEVGGQLVIHADNLSLLDGGALSASNVGQGDGGQIRLEISDSLLARGELLDPNFPGNSGIFAESETTAASRPGLIDVAANTVRVENGGRISTQTFGQSDGGDVFIHAEQVDITDNNANTTTASVQANTTGKGAAGNIEIIADRLEISQLAQVTSNTEGSGKGGVVRIEAGQFALIDGGILASSTLASGDAGDIIIHAEQVMLRGTSAVSDNVSAISGGTRGSGDGGNLQLTTQTLAIADGAQITSSTNSSGDAGTIEITSDETTISGISTDGFVSGIFGRTIGEDKEAGRGALIDITTETLTLTERATISSSTAGPGEGGMIQVTASDLDLLDDASITADSLSLANGAGNAGSIVICSHDSLNLENNSRIATSALNAAGGNIRVDAPNTLHIRESAINTSVTGGVGRGGDITIGGKTAAQFIIVENGRIVAQADEGRGGDITITTDQFIRSSGSLISASSRLGIDGTVLISSPDPEIVGDLVTLPTRLLTNAELAEQQCSISEISSRFVVIEATQVPQDPKELR